MQEQQKPSDKTISIADIFFKSRELEARGFEIIHLDVGEPDYEPPPEVIKETISALESFKGRYTLPGGIIEVRKAIADHVREKYGILVSPDRVIFTSGGRMALFLAFASLPKDSLVGVISPDWPAYRDICRFLSLNVKFIDTKLENSWTPDLGEIESSGCTALAINYPNNPTGKLLDLKFFDELIQVANRHNMKIVSDEVYSDFILNEKKFKSILEQPTPTGSVFTSSLSKSYSMTGFRAAYLISDSETASKLSQINGLLLTSAPEFIQYSAISALKQKEFVAEKTRLIKGRMLSACQALERLGAEYYPPDGSLYIFPKLRSSSGKPVDSASFALNLLEKEHVSLTPGTVFGQGYDSYVRITALQSESKLAEGIERMSRLLDE